MILITDSMSAYFDREHTRIIIGGADASHAGKLDLHRSVDPLLPAFDIDRFHDTEYITSVVTKFPAHMWMPTFVDTVTDIAHKIARGEIRQQPIYVYTSKKFFDDKLIAYVNARFPRMHIERASRPQQN